jgi:hypothetical protein
MNYRLVFGWLYPLGYGAQIVRLTLFAIDWQAFFLKAFGIILLLGGCNMLSIES